MVTAKQQSEDKLTSIEAIQVISGCSDDLTVVNYKDAKAELDNNNYSLAYSVAITGMWIAIIECVAIIIIAAINAVLDVKKLKNETTSKEVTKTDVKEMTEEKMKNDPESKYM